MINNSSEQLIIFTRYPQAGAVKTRLAAKLGYAGAARLHQNLTEHVLQQVLPVTAARPAQLKLFYSGGSGSQMTGWLGDSLPLIQQSGKNLGERMLTAFQTARRQYAMRTILIGSDCPFVNDTLLINAFEQLLLHEIIIGPSVDGGYYLIGMNSNVPDHVMRLLFADICWGTNIVYRQTLKKIKSTALSHVILQQLPDIDRPQDLEYFHHYTDT